MLKLKVELTGTDAKRVVVVPEDCTLEGLHEILQALFAWDGSHLWSFKGKNDLRWELPSDRPFALFGLAPNDPAETCIGTVLSKKGAHLDYTYDFGDSWHHRITRMTDPKDGTSFGCVKTEGPDGVEDCGGPFGLADEDLHVPTVDEINRRLPKKLKTGEYVPPVNADEPDNVTLWDAVSSKSMDVLSQIGTDGERKLSRTECIERSVKLMEEHPETLKLFLCGLNERHYRVMMDALMKNAGFLNYPFPNEVGIFEGCPYVYVEQCKRTQYRIVAPRELRRIWQENCMEWGGVHDRWNEIERFASAAVRLYGALDVADFVALLRHYEVVELPPQELVAYVLDVRSYGGEANYAVVEAELRLIDFDEENVLGEEMGLYADFCAKRADASRCTSLSREEFLAYAEDEYVEDVEAVRTLRSFVERKLSPRESPRLPMRQIVEGLVCGDEPGEIVARLSKIDYPNKEKCSESLIKLIVDVRHNIRLPIYNGHTYRELKEKYSA